MACPRESTGSHLITEVLLGRVSVQMGNHPSVPTGLNLTLWFFSGYSGVPPSPKIDSQSKTSGLGASFTLGPCMTVWWQPETPFICMWPIPS